MRFPDQSYNLRIELDTKHCTLSPGELDKMETGLHPLGKVVQDFPVSDLYLTVIHYPRSHDWHVKMSLVLSGRTLTTGERHEVMYSAYEHCIRKLVKQVEAYKHSLSNMPEVAKHEKGTHQDVLPTQEPNAATLEEAVRAADYVAFRQATFGYEEPIRKRIGRWVQRYPQVNALIGNGIALADIVEEVFLNAFEGYEHRPAGIRLGDWLEHLIDPSLKALLHDPDGEMENIRFARTLTETEAQPE